MCLLSLEKWRSSDALARLFTKGLGRSNAIASLQSRSTLSKVSVRNAVWSPNAWAIVFGMYLVCYCHVSPHDLGQYTGCNSAEEEVWHDAGKSAVCFQRQFDGTDNQLLSQMLGRTRKQVRPHKIGISKKGMLTKGCLSFLPPLTGARSCSMGCSLRVSMVQNSSSPLGSATPEDDLTAAGQALSRQHHPQ